MIPQSNVAEAMLLQKRIFLGSSWSGPLLGPLSLGAEAKGAVGSAAPSDSLRASSNGCSFLGRGVGTGFLFPGIPTKGCVARPVPTRHCGRLGGTLPGRDRRPRTKGEGGFVSAAASLRGRWPRGSGPEELRVHPTPSPASSRFPNPGRTPRADRSTAGGALLVSATRTFFSSAYCSEKNAECASCERMSAVRYSIEVVDWTCSKFVKHQIKKEERKNRRRIEYDIGLVSVAFPVDITRAKNVKSLGF